MTDSDSSVSVVIPAFNCARYLPAAIASVQSQGSPDLQVVVVDDGSTDDTQAIVRAIPGVEYRRQARAGAAAARNAGVRVADGKYLAFLDADDYWAPGKIARQLHCLFETGTDMVFGHAEEFQSPDAPALAGSAPPAAAQPARCAGTVLIARETFVSGGMFSTAWRVGEFMDWYLRATDRGLTATMLPDVVLYRRLHSGNSGRRAGSATEDYVRIIREAMTRRRAAGSM